MRERLPKMRKFEERDNDTNLIKTMVQDSIQRNIELVYFIRKLSTLEEGSKIIAVNGKWGSGKTFFLRQFQLLTNFYSNKVENRKELQDCISKYEIVTKITPKNRFGLLKEECEEFAIEECCEVLYFNAWEYDGNNDPIKSLMYFLIEHYKLDYETIKINWKELGKKLTRFLFNIEYGDNTVEKINSFEDIVANNDIKNMWTSLLDESINENCNKLYFIIDDLDRCRPDYAIKMLERIKHFANDERVNFILAVDYEEMLCVIEQFYGYRNSGNRFLEKIIDYYVDLEDRHYNDYDKYIGDYIIKHRVGDEYLTVAEVINNTMKYVTEDLRMTMREMAKCREILAYMSSFYDEYAGIHAGDLGNTILKGIVMPYILGLNVTNRVEYYKFIRGEGQDAFIDFIQRHEELIVNIELEKSKIKEKFEGIYEFITKVMKGDKNIIETKDIDNIRLYESTVKDVFKCINGLYDFEICGDTEELSAEEMGI